jgi:hypothetical protein
MSHFSARAALAEIAVNAVAAIRHVRCFIVVPSISD